MTNQEAIEFLSQIRDFLLANNSWLPSTDNPIKESFGMAINALTAQPETHACDCVSKTSVCEILADIYPTDGEKVVAVKEVDKAYEAIQQLPSAQPEPYIDSIVSEIEKTISETRERGKHHDINVRANGEMICFGLQLALEIIEEKKNGRSDIQTGSD